MKRLVFTRDGGLVTGPGSLEYLKQTDFSKAFLVTGGSSMQRFGVIDTALKYLGETGCECEVYSGIGKNPSEEEVLAGLDRMRQVRPDVVIAIGGGSAMDAAKCMLLFYEFPELTFQNVAEKIKEDAIPHACKCKLICVGSTSGTASEVTRVTVITDTKKRIKVPINTECIRPDIAILDGEIAMTMPDRIAAETGMDALTHAIEAYTNHNLDDFTEVICKGAIEGIMKNLVASVKCPTLATRQSMHNYQAMAGMGFANVGLGMVHGIAHSFGAVFNLAHGLTNAVILPYVLDYNRQDSRVERKLRTLSYACKCEDIVEEIRSIREVLDIPNTFQEAGIPEEDFIRELETLTDHAMLGATRVNPIEISKEDMRLMVEFVYYGREEWWK